MIPLPIKRFHLKLRAIWALITNGSYHLIVPDKKGIHQLKHYVDNYTIDKTDKDVEQQNVNLDYVKNKLTGIQ